MVGRLGFEGVVLGDTDLGDLRGYLQAACAGLAGQHAAWRGRLLLVACARTPQWAGFPERACSSARPPAPGWRRWHAGPGR